MKRGWRKDAGRLAGAVWKRESPGELAVGLSAAVRPVWRKKGGAVCIPHSAVGLQPRRIQAISRSGS